MSAQKNIVSQIEIKTTASKLWNVLTNPLETKKYMFGCETISDWSIGSSLLWQGEYEGKKMIFVKGNIIEIIQNKKLIYSVIDPNNSEIPDIPENYLNVSYTIEAFEYHCKLKVIQGDYNQVAQGEKRYKEAYNNGEGWGPILREIKKILED